MKHNMKHKTEILSCGFKYAGKEDIGMGFWNPKEKPIKLQFGKKRHTLLCILKKFRIIVIIPPIFFLDSNSPCKDLPFHIYSSRAYN